MTLTQLRSNTRAQVILGLAFGIIFGFLLQKGGVTEYDVILGQLLLTDFTVVKIMLAAIVVGMIGVFLMKWAGIVTLHTRKGSLGATVIGGLIFGAGFAVLGYCPGTAAGAFGSGAIDAAIGMTGIVIGAGIFARLYPALDRILLNRGEFPVETIPELVGMKQGTVVAVVAVLILCLLYAFEVLGI